MSSTATAQRPAGAERGWQAGAARPQIGGARETADHARRPADRPRRRAQARRPRPSSRPAGRRVSNSERARQSSARHQVRSVTPASVNVAMPRGTRLLRAATGPPAPLRSLPEAHPEIEQRRQSKRCRPAPDGRPRPTRARAGRGRAHRRAMRAAARRRRCKRSRPAARASGSPRGDRRSENGRKFASAEAAGRVQRIAQASRDVAASAGVDGAPPCARARHRRPRCPGRPSRAARRPAAPRQTAAAAVVLPIPISPRAEKVGAGPHRRDSRPGPPRGNPPRPSPGLA